MLFINGLPTALNRYDSSPLYKIERHHEIVMKLSVLFVCIILDYHFKKNDSI